MMPEKSRTPAALDALQYVFRAAVLSGLVLILATCTTSEPDAGSSASAPSTAVAPELVLVGSPGFSFEDFGLELSDRGYNVAVNSGEIRPTTDLVLVVVNGQDGPQPQTRDAIEALVGKVLPRVAIAITDVDKQPDAELEALVLLETVQLLAVYGIAPVDGDNVVRWPGSNVASTLEVHLRRGARDYRPVEPAVPQASSAATVVVGNFAGVPMTDALRILAEQGLRGEVLADIRHGVVSDCNPLVGNQVPASGGVLAYGGIVGLIVPPPDKVDPAMAGCLLPELTPAQIDARMAEVAAQPTP